jgi:DNA polymerase-3 subunit alpha
MSRFAYLRVHSHFSFGGGPASPHDWCRRAAELGYGALGMAGRAPLADLPALTSAASRHGLAALYGVEIDLLFPIYTAGRKAQATHSALLFAHNAQGLAGLAKLSSLAYAGWPVTGTPLTWDVVAGHSAGMVLILCGPAHPEGTAAQGRNRGDSRRSAPANPTLMAEIGNLLREAFGEMAFVGLPADDDGPLSAWATAAEHMRLPPVALLTARYLHPQDAIAYEALRVARRNAGWSGLEEGRQAHTGSYHLRPPDEAAKLFEEHPQALQNLGRVLEMCAVGKPVAMPLRDDAIRTLGELCERRLLTKLGVEQLPHALRERLEAELAAVQRAGSAGSWLGLASVVQTALGVGNGNGAQQIQQIPLGAPLGAAHGSLMAFALGASTVDPTPYTGTHYSDHLDRLLRSPLGIEVPAVRKGDLLAALRSEHGPDRTACAAAPVEILPCEAVAAAGAVLGIGSDDLRRLVTAAVEQGWAALDAPDSPDASHTGHTRQDTACAALARCLRGTPIWFRPDPDMVLLAPRAAYGGLNLAEVVPVLPCDTYDIGGLGRWVPWPPSAISELEPPLPAIHMPATWQLSVLSEAVGLAARHPTAGLDMSGVDLSVCPRMSEQAQAFISKGQVAGIPYLTSAVRGWGGGFTQDDAALMVAICMSPGANSANKPPPGLDIPAWSEITQDTGGRLVYQDQLDRILQAVGGISDGETAGVRVALLNPQSNVGQVERKRFMQGCAVNGLDEQTAETLWQALVECAPGVVSRYAASAWGRVGLWCAELKAAHPAALLAAALAAAWERGDTHLIARLAEEARRLGVPLRPPDAVTSLPRPSLEREGTGWAIVWGLAMLPGWDVTAAERFVAARRQDGPSSLGELALTAVDAGITATQLDVLIRTGACDRLGGRERDRQALIEALPAALMWAMQRRSSGMYGASAKPESSRDTRPPDQLHLFSAIAQHEPPDETDTYLQQPPTPYRRYAWRSWEERHIGLAFTQAAEMEALRRIVHSLGDLRSRLLTTAQIDAGRIGQSICLIGVLCSIRLVDASGTSSSAGDGNHTVANGAVGKSRVGRGKDAPPPQQEGAYLAVGRIEDLDGSIELVAFPPNYMRHRALWTEGNVVIVTARVSRHPDGELYLLCEHLAPYHVQGGEDDTFEVKVRTRKGANTSKERGPQDAGTDADAVGVEVDADAGARPEVGVPATVSSPAMATAGKGSSTGAYPPPAHGFRSTSPGAQSAAVATTMQLDERRPDPNGKPSYRVVITLPCPEDDQTAIDMMIALHNLLLRHPGPDEVKLRIPYSPQTGHMTSAQLPRGVSYNHILEAEIQALLGMDALAVIKLT